MAARNSGINLHIATPTLDRMGEINDESQKIGQFLDWLQGERKLVLAEFVEHLDYPVPVHLSIEKLLAEYFEIDLGAAERERVAILKGVRAVNELRDPVR